MIRRVRPKWLDTDAAFSLARTMGSSPDFIEPISPSIIPVSAWRAFLQSKAVVRKAWLQVEAEPFSLEMAILGWAASLPVSTCFLPVMEIVRAKPQNVKSARWW
jgi:hypothetical protein